MGVAVMTVARTISPRGTAPLLMSAGFGARPWPCDARSKRVNARFGMRAHLLDAGGQDPRFRKARYVMEKTDIGDLVVLASGSMRMVVEATEGDQVACLWCHEGRIGRDTFNMRLLRKWEHREDDHRGSRSEGGGKPFRAGGDRNRERDGGGDKPHRGGDRDDRPPRGKPGWDGKPREKKFFRKDG